MREVGRPGDAQGEGDGGGGAAAQRAVRRVPAVGGEEEGERGEVEAVVEEDVEQAPEAEGDEAGEGGGGSVTYWHLRVGGERTGRDGHVYP